MISNTDVNRLLRAKWGPSNIWWLSQPLFSVHHCSLGLKLNQSRWIERAKSFRSSTSSSLQMTSAPAHLDQEMELAIQRNRAKGRWIDYLLLLCKIYSCRSECSDLGGTAGDDCAEGFGVCCYCKFFMENVEFAVFSNA